MRALGSAGLSLLCRNLMSFRSSMPGRRLLCPQELEVLYHLLFMPTCGGEPHSLYSLPAGEQEGACFLVGGMWPPHLGRPRASEGPQGPIIVRVTVHPCGGRELAA